MSKINLMVEGMNVCNFPVMFNEDFDGAEAVDVRERLVDAVNVLAVLNDMKVKKTDIQETVYSFAAMCGAYPTIFKKIFSKKYTFCNKEIKRAEILVKHLLLIASAKSSGNQLEMMEAAAKDGFTRIYQVLSYLNNRNNKLPKEMNICLSECLNDDFISESVDKYFPQDVKRLCIDGILFTASSELEGKIINEFCKSKNEILGKEFQEADVIDKSSIIKGITEISKCVTECVIKEYLVDYCKNINCTTKNDYSIALEVYIPNNYFTDIEKELVTKVDDDDRW